MAARDVPKISIETDVTASELAAVLGITASRIYQLVKDGVMQPVRKGRYMLSDCVQAYVKLVTKAAASADDIKTEKTLRTSTAVLRTAKARIAKLEADELEGKLHRSEDVAALTADMVYTIRDMLNAMPGRLATDVAASGSAAEAADIISREVKRILRELAKYRYDPQAYAERVNARKDWSGPVDGDEDDA